MLAWKDEYSTGVEDLDEQHRDLFDFTNRLEKYISEGLYEGPQVEMLLGFLGSYAQAHFFIEEMCMRNNHCPSSEQNDKAHAKFLEFFTNFNQLIKEKGSSLALLQKLHSVMEKWLTQHICKIDIHLKKCVFKSKEVVVKNEKGETIATHQKQ